MNFAWDAVIGTIVGVISVLTSIVLGVRWLVKHYFDEIKHELKPNSGKSIKDQVNRMELDILKLTDQNTAGDEFHQKLESKLDNLTHMFIDYLSRNKN